MTALIVAASKENNEIVKLLLEHPKINVNIQDYLERTALIVAASNKNNETVKLLLEHPNINVDIKNADGNTALMMAATEGNTENLMNILRKNADINIQNKDGNTALILVAPKKNTEIINLLLEHPNINVNIQNNLGRTALMLAATQGTTENLMNILRKNPDTDIKNNDGNTALMMATKARKVSIMNAFNKHERELVRRNKTLFVNEMMKQKYGFVMTPDTMEQLYKELKKESPPNGGAKSHRKRKTGKAGITKKRTYRNQ
jgi:ankyrin repeat protein